MNTVEALSSICNSLKNEKFNLEEFQSRLESLMISNEEKIDLEKVIFNAINRLEEIRFTSLESNYYKYGSEVADTIREKIGLLIDRFK